MKKLLLIGLTFLGFNSLVCADSKLSALTQDTTAQAGDLLYKVDNPSGTPSSRSISVTNLFGAVAVSSLSTTGVVAGTYGSATQVSTFTVNAQGRISSAGNTTISLTNSNLQVGSYSNVTVPAANVAAGSLGASVLASSYTATGVTAASYTNTNLTVDAQGRISSASNGSASGGSSTLAVSSNNVVVSSPTSNINFMPPFNVTLQGSTSAQVTLNSSSVTLQGQSVLSFSSAAATYQYKNDNWDWGVNPSTIGIVETFVSASNSISTGTICYITSNGRMAPADNTAAATTPGVYLALGTYPNTSSGKYLVKGVYTLGSFSFTPGQTIYLGTSGGITTTAPTTVDYIIQIVGMAIDPAGASSTHTLYFDPQLITVTYQ